ncbi:MAG: glycosyltransferase family 4 protein [Bacteroidales bacterium]|nr:glycosyltransferase family 4 protein [Bacteroidales bacterium]
MKRVLIITYYWPPSGGAGVQRWLKFVKYLRETGYEPVVYTPLNHEIPYRDDTLLADISSETEVIGIKIFEPYQLYNLLTGKKKGAKFQHGFLKDKEDVKHSLKERLAVWIRGNIFIPDARSFWIKPSIKFLSKYLNEHPVDLIVSSGPPHSMHMIGLGIKKLTHLPWIADFRDPWTGIYYFDKLMLSGFARKKHFMLEQKCLDNADHLITVGQTMKNDFEKRTSRPISVITNGFDHVDFEKTETTQVKKFTLLYSGMFLPDQNPPELWETLNELVEEDPNFAKHLDLFFIGKTDAAILEDIKKNNLTSFLRQKDYVPHAQLPQLQQEAAILLLSINRISNASYILTGKVFEYLAAQKTILAFCPFESDVASIIRETNSGLIIPFGQKALLKDNLQELFRRYLNNNLIPKQKNTNSYSRKSLTKELAKVFEEVLKLKR